MIDRGPRCSLREAHALAYSLTAFAAFTSGYLVSMVTLRWRFAGWAEAAIAFLAAFVAYRILLYSDLRSEPTARMRQALRAKVDRIYFRNDLFVSEVEPELDRRDQGPLGPVGGACSDEQDPPPAVEDEREARQLAAYLERRSLRGRGEVSAHDRIDAGSEAR